MPWPGERLQRPEKSQIVARGRRILLQANPCKRALALQAFCCTSITQTHRNAHTYTSNKNNHNDDNNSIMLSEALIKELGHLAVVDAILC